MILLLLACTSGDDSASTKDPSGCEAGSNPVLTLGKGELSYAPMDAGDGTVELVHGPQGGFHTVIALEAVAADAATEWTVQIRGYLADVERATTTPYVTMQCNNQTGTLQAWGFLLTHFALRALMHEAALGALPRARDPDTVSFTHTLRVTRRTLSHVAALPPSGPAAAAAGAASRARGNSPRHRQLEPRSRRAPRRQTEDE